MSIETLHQLHDTPRSEDGEKGTTHSKVHYERPDLDEIVDATIVEDSNLSDELATTKYPAGERGGAGVVEEFTSKDWAELERMLAQEALKAQPPVPQDSTQPTKVTYIHLDQSHDAEAAARRIAEQKVKERAANIEGGLLKRKIKEAWANFTVPFTYQKARREALDAIKERGGDIYANVDTTDGKWQTAHDATHDRLTSGIKEALHKDERYEDAENDKFVSGTKELIRKNANGELSDEALVEEMRRFRENLREEYGTEELGKGVAQLDNIVAVAQAVRGAVEHGESLEAVLENMEVKVGETRAGVRQEQQKNFTDRMIDKLHTSKLSMIVSPEVASTAGAAIGMLGHAGTSKTVSKLAHIGGLAGGVVGAAGLAAARERSHLRAERAHRHEAKAEGREVDAGEKMSEFDYEIASSDELLASLNFESLDLSSREDIRKALEYLGHVEARVALTDATGKNLIGYNDIMDVSEQRWALDLARAEAKCQLRPYIDDPAMLHELGVPDGVTFDRMIDRTTNLLMEGVTAKDEAFKKWSRWQMAKAATWAGASSLTFGLVGSEVFAAFADKTTGVFEKTDGQDGKRETLLAALAGKFGFGGNGQPIDGATSFADRSFGAHGTVTMPDGMELQNNPDGTVNLSYGDMKINDVPMEKNGTLSPETLARLRDQGLQITDMSHAVETPATKTVHGGTLHEFMQANRSQTEHVTRVGWSDNDTARPDKNELKIWWGGKDNNGIRPGGGYQFDISQMATGGSSHDGLHENWKELAKEGKLKMFISPSAGEQTHPFVIDIGPDGKVDIPKDHPAASLFSVHDGQTRFDGKYAEVAQIVGENDKGATEIRPLATEVGTDAAKDKDYTYTEKTKTDAFKPAYNVWVVGGDGASLDYHTGPWATVPRTFAKPARPRPVDTEDVPPVPPAPLAALGRQRELEGGGYQPELEPASVRPELEAAGRLALETRPLLRQSESPRRVIELGSVQQHEYTGKPEAPAIEHRDRGARAAIRPRVWSPFWQGDSSGGRTPSVEAPVVRPEEETKQNEAVERLQTAAREALRSGRVSVTEMERSLRGQLGAGGAYVTVVYDRGRPVDYRVRVTDMGASRLDEFLRSRFALELRRPGLQGQRRQAIEMGPASNPELEA